MKKISVIVPCYNEEENIPFAYAAIKAQLDLLGDKYDYEILFADNGSSDRSEEVFEKIAADDKNVKVIFNQTNFGPDRSVTNLYKRTTGELIIGICCDLQEPPEMIPEFVKCWEETHCDVVFGQKTKSRENPIKFLCRKMYYGIIDGMSDCKQFHQVTGFGLITKEVRDIILQEKSQDPEMNLRHIVPQYGFDVKLLPYTQRKRERGKSSYNLYRYYDFAISSLCSTSIKPLRLMTIFGMTTSFVCFVVAIVYFIYKLTHWYTFDAGMAPIVIGLFFIAGVLLLCMGILGEYVSILMRRVTDRPIVVEKRTLNMDEDRKTDEDK
ncbi:MAG: glycosyltransferase family 2 protein [Lachnospiraceae bacterium]|nr:glycosyltransferase family 2 protein [Lachnospiraceae bacterium]